MEIEGRKKGEMAVPSEKGIARGAGNAVIHKKSIWKKAAQRWQLYLFLLIPVVYLIIFCYWPMAGVQIAFRKYKIRLGIWGSQWVGWYQFEKFFTSFYFGRVLGNTLRLSLYSLIVGFPLPVIFALQLNAMRSAKGRKFIQTVTYMPHFISTVVMVGIINQMLNPTFGIYGRIFRMLYGGNATPPNLLLSSAAFPHIYVLSGVWQGLGWSTIIYTAALSAVDPSLHEAATIDGANRLQRIVHVDFPAILPTVSITLILRFGGIMGIGFDKTYLLQNGANLVTSEVIATYVYKQAFDSSNMDYSYATAIGLFNSVIGLFMLALVNWISRKVSDSSLW